MGINKLPVLLRGANEHACQRAGESIYVCPVVRERPHWERRRNTAVNSYLSRGGAVYAPI